MRIILVFAISAVAFLSMGSLAPNGNTGSAARADQTRPSSSADQTQQSDTCWWWGARWQYGWRGFGWYGCFEQAAPLPVVETLQAGIKAGEGATGRRSCMPRLREEAGYRHSRRVC
jgi:hypothetical protein